MVQIIDQLGRDHRNLRLLLDIVEEEMDAYREGCVPDFDLLRMVAEYTLHYPDLVHHPRENVIFERLRVRDPAAGEIIGTLGQEHKKLAELTRRFVGAVSNASRDVQLPREWLDAVAKEYVLANRLHMQIEEEHFFPRAMAYLTVDDWAGIDQRVARADDPVFGEKVEEAYLYLHERVLRLHEIRPLVRQPHPD
ncbi:MAG TPA: hemerythrin domain-containing protein [Methylomirabilota bacterium]|nr:hemerythrin domain-containing protein [Methylomirabilota bacterium]